MEPLTPRKKAEDLIREAIEAQGISWNEAARRIGVSPQRLRHAMRQKDIQVGTLANWLHALGYRLVLMADKEEE